MTTPLLATKLCIPPVRSGLVPRPRLIEQLSAGLHCRLTLISAQAGSGKTTLISEWLQHRQSPGTQEGTDSVDRSRGAGPTGADIAAAKALLAQAEASLTTLLGGASDAQVAVAKAEIRRAQAQLELIEAGARPQAIAVAEADVAAAEAALAGARAAVAETELRAPFAGAVAGLEAKVGEQVTPGTPVVQLADFSTWQIETDDLTELGVVEISQGDPVTITVDAIPDLELPGEVKRIQAIGEDKYGDITYTVVVQPARQDERLRWNMTTAVFIQPRSGEGVARSPGGGE